MISELSKSNLKEIIFCAFTDCRAKTLALFEEIDEATLCCQAHPDFSPVGWHFGHIAYTESLWLLERSAGLPCMFPQYRKLFTADGLPKSERVKLPNQEEIRYYLDTVREKVLNYLEVADLETEERLWSFLLQHESQHSEIITFILEMQRFVGQASHLSKYQGGQDAQRQSLQRGKPQPQFPTEGNPPSGLAPQRAGSPTSVKSKITAVATTLGTKATRCLQNHGSRYNFGHMSNALPPKSKIQTPAEMIQIPGGEFEMGNDSEDALDNERLRHRVYLDTYWIDRYPVTCGQYRTFMEAGGYENAQWWSKAGWEWLQTEKVRQPLYWHDDSAWDNHPVCGVSWYEAEAYAQFVGKRLPTEAEWEKAASWDEKTNYHCIYPWGDEEPTLLYCNYDTKIHKTTAVDAYPAGQSAYGLYDTLGNVWEWTATWFDGYEGFKYYPYIGYSQVYFDRQHRVLKGGSWATRPWVLRCSFRNWYQPRIRQILAGFRCARTSI